MPAQAEVQFTHTAKIVPLDSLGGGTSGSPLDLLGGLLGGDLLSSLGGGLGGLGGGLGGLTKSNKPKADDAMADAIARDTADENRRASLAMTPNAAEDVTRSSGPLPELSPILGGMAIGGGGQGITKSLPLLGGARMAQPLVKAAPPSHTEVTGTSAPLRGAMDTMSGLVGASVGGAMGKVGGGMLLPGMGAGNAGNAGNTAATMTGAAKGLRDLSTETAVGGLGRAARMALPHASGAELGPMVGQVAPVEAAPVVEALPGTTQAASVDEITPLMADTAGLVSSNGSKAAGSYSDMVSALGWSTDALTSSVRGPWARD
ncbi:hypothetical protein ACFFV7_14880 [Nonomuraea spiralis]|uniref:Uncharacterized protein n=1 Tax=Nonomuraea spiralis TaxID=46182 RepID=A0ABV5ID71_9ACTN|nr:hypothetical protein [Nonomuraea spiralis]